LQIPYPKGRAKDGKGQPPIMLGVLRKSLVGEPLPPYFCPKVNGDYLGTVQKPRKGQGSPGTLLWANVLDENKCKTPQLYTCKQNPITN
jgi:hypothetical protein